jgi:16S rRNA (guanine527-N7)-methyltransferase
MKEFQKLIDVFIERNQKINLSSIRNPEDIYIKHILDSLELNKIIKFKKWDQILDIWTWWWFPLLPLAMSNLDSNFVWIDWKQKKVKAVNDMIDKLWLSKCKWIWSRIEELKWEFNYITARAVWYIDKIIPRSYWLLKKWWYFCLYKIKSTEENRDIHKICSKYNLDITQKHEYKLYKSNIERVIYIIKKN